MNLEMRNSLCAIVTWGALCGVAHAASATSDAAETMQCRTLADTDFSGIQDASTQIVDAKVIDANDREPSYCQVTGYVWPQVGFQLQLPTRNWNGKLIEIGCGGACGTFQWAFWCPLHRGYACIVSDMGHKGKDQDLLWSNDNLQAQADFGFRGPHVTALAGKAIAQVYFKKEPDHSYFMGCSTGGRQAMVEAQRFPWDFDGIIAGAADIDESGQTMNRVWTIRSMRGSGGELLLTPADLRLVHDAAVKECDMDDGVKDGIISNPPACTFDPSALLCRADKRVGCLTESQVQALKRIYNGPVNSAGRKLYPGGAMRGSELNWIDSADDYVRTDNRVGGLEEWSNEFLRHLGFTPAAGRGWNLTDFNFDTDYKRFGVVESFMSGSNPDLRKFKAAGGKLIVYQGWADDDVVPEDITSYYEMAERTMGGRAATQEFFRLFMVPGMGHCFPGKGASVIDYLSYLESWVEKGQAPDKLIGAHVDDTYLLQRRHMLSVLKYPLAPAIPVTFTRPIYPYPLRAKYKGAGDPTDAGNFESVER